MAGIIWADPAIHELDSTADYAALENTAGARKLVQQVFAAVERLRKFPLMGSLPIELSGLPCRQLIISPCRIFYRAERKVIYIVHVLRAEQLVRREQFPPSASKPPGKWRRKKK